MVPPGRASMGPGRADLQLLLLEEEGMKLERGGGRQRGEKSRTSEEMKTPPFHFHPSHILRNCFRGLKAVR